MGIFSHIFTFCMRCILWEQHILRGTHLLNFWIHCVNYTFWPHTKTWIRSQSTGNIDMRIRLAYFERRTIFQNLFSWSVERNTIVLMEQQIKSGLLLFLTGGFFWLYLLHVSFLFFVPPQKILCEKVLTASGSIWFLEATDIPIGSMRRFLGPSMIMHEVALCLWDINGSIHDKTIKPATSALLMKV